MVCFREAKEVVWGSRWLADVRLLQGCGVKELAREAANEALCSATMMSPEVEQLIGKAVVELKAAGARQVFAFGSAARGTLRPDSDLDLAVSGLPPAKFYRAMARASDAAGRAIDLLDLDRPTPFGRYLVEANELVCVG